MAISTRLFLPTEKIWLSPLEKLGRMRCTDPLAGGEPAQLLDEQQYLGLT
jgi:hypothetical protein